MEQETQFHVDAVIIFFSKIVIVVVGDGGGGSCCCGMKFEVRPINDTADS